ncbi:MAG TPA: hypothetical protein VLT45_26775, partial [Kofleriaceae bacterium]|nr:hypothetical protein [Kofleriaceae bacterium]
LLVDGRRRIDDGRMEERELTRQEVWAIYERGARQQRREFVVLTIVDPPVPLPYEAGMATERMAAVDVENFDFLAL